MKLNRPFWWMITGSSTCVILAIFGFREILLNEGINIEWFFFSFSMLLCGVFGFALTLVAIPIRERVASVHGRIILFGICAGLLWSLAPGGLSGAFKTFGIPTVLIAGGMTGVIVSVVLYKPLLKSSRWNAFSLGIVVLPLGAFCFGLCEPLIYFITHGVSMARGNEQFSPLILGIQYAVLSVISLYVEILIPLAILTTFSLRAVILFKAQEQ